MAAPICVLLYGDMPSLSEVRSILIPLKCQVFSAATFCNMVELVPSVAIDLLILCESVSKKESARMMTFAAARWPHSRTMCISAEGSDNTPNVLKQVTDAFQTSS